MSSQPVVLVDYDPAWPELFVEEKQRIIAQIGEYVEDIQHIGSTAVPGLGAKPVIDMLVAIRDLSLVERCVQPLERIGYEYLGEHGIPDRHFFRKYIETAHGELGFHIHMMQKTHSEWSRHIMFRDYLRRHPEAARQYLLLKQELAARYGADRDAYSEAKRDFVRSILRAATRTLAAGDKSSTE